MPIRIYALAKQLNVDSKVLANVCDQVGISGKGSALASLSDEEAEKVKAYLSNRGAKPAAKPAGRRAAAEPEKPQVLRREDYIAPAGTAGGKVRVLTTRPKPKSEPKVESQPEPSAPTAPEVSASAPAAPTSPAPPAAPVEPESAVPVEESKPVVEPSLPPAPERPKVAPLAAKLLQKSKGPIRTIQAKRAKGSEKPRPAQKSGPAIKLAPMPTASEPPRKGKTDEPAPQKPDIKLPPDAIRAGKLGSTPLSEHIRKHEKKKAAKKGGRGEVGGADVAKEEVGRERGVRRGVGRGEVPPEKGVPALGGREARQLKRKRSTTARRRKSQDEESTVVPRRKTRIRRTGTTNTAAPRKSSVSVELPCTVKTFSEAVGISVAQLLGKLMQLGAMSCNINSNLEHDMAELLAAEFGVDVSFQEEVALEDKLLLSLEQEEAPEDLELRPPIVTFLGHVDHGKTSLLDRIMEVNVVSGEKGGITQHIRAYQIEKDGGKIAFVDTPGHEAFTEMRARGANVTDIAVLVVAADDGVMPQTEEAISHARAAGVPIVVALNKIDLPGVNAQRAYEQLAANELLPSEWGGDVEVIKTSATTGEGIDELLDTLLTVAELHEFKANPKRAGVGTCLEAELHEGRGVVAKLLVQRGTMKVGDVVVCGSAFGRVKAMYDTLEPRKRHEEAGPSMPVNVTGLNTAPGAGDRFYVLQDISEARHLAEQRADEARQRELSGISRPHITLENLFDRLGEEEVQTLNVILRADVRGSIEAIRKELTKLEHPEVQIKILQATVGGVTEADVHLADASDAIIIGFNVVPDEGARSLAEQRGVQIRRYDIIYQVTEDLKAALEGMLRPEKQEKDLGRALVQLTFHISRIGTVAGCRVLAGNIERDSRVRVIRDSRIIGDYKLDSLKREKDDVRDVREGMECGIKLSGFNDLKEGDILEVYKVEEIGRTFSGSLAASE